MFGKKETGPFCHRALPAQMTCLKGDCNRWQIAPAEKEVNGEKTVTLHGDCGDNWQLLYLKAIAFRTDGTQVAVESFRNETVKGNDALLSFIKGGGLSALPKPAGEMKVIEPEPGKG